jgi:hypothetical protein
MAYGLIGFYFLKLKKKRVNSLNLNWTTVYPCLENSSFYGLTETDFKNGVGKTIVVIYASYNMFGKTVVKLYFI